MDAHEIEEHASLVATMVTASTHAMADDPIARWRGVAWSRPGHAPRLAGWDYTSSGAYAITIVTARRAHSLSTVRDGEVTLRPAGVIVAACWDALPTRFATVRLDAMVLMPDHLHAIIWIDRPETAEPVPTVARVARGLRPMMADPRTSLAKVVRAWKADSTRRIRRSGLTDFAWQPRFYDQIIRGDEQLYRTRRYIALNPIRYTPPHASTVARAHASTRSA